MAGIADHERERIFGPLEQLEELNIRVHQGTGMGLALSRTAARAMDGDVVLERVRPRGLDLPVDDRPRGRLTRTARPRSAQVNRRMCTFSSIPTAAQLISSELPP